MQLFRLPERPERRSLSVLQTKTNGTGKVTYRVGWRKARRYAYLYERTYEGAVGHAKPKYSEVCLGAIDKVRAEQAGQAELRAMAFALAREGERRG